MKLSTIWTGDTSRRTGSTSSLPRYAGTNCDWFSMNYGQMADFTSANSSSVSSNPNSSPVNSSPANSANGNNQNGNSSSSGNQSGPTLMNLSGSAVNLLSSSNAFNASSPSSTANGNSFNGLLLNSIANQEAAVAAVTSSIINHSSNSANQTNESASSPARQSQTANGGAVSDLLTSNYSLKSNSKLSNSSSSNYNPRKMIKTEHFSNSLGSTNLLSSFAKLPSSGNQSHLLNGRASGASLSSASSSSSSTASPNSSLSVPNITGGQQTSNNLHSNLLQSAGNSANNLLDANDLIPTSSLLSVLTADHASPVHQGHLNSNRHNSALSNSSNTAHGNLSNQTSSPLHQHHLNNLNNLNNNASAATLLSLHSAAAARNSSSASSSPITNSITNSNTLNININNNLIMPKNSSMMCGSASADLMSMSTAMLFNGNFPIFLLSIYPFIRLAYKQANLNTFGSLPLKEFLDKTF